MSSGLLRPIAGWARCYGGVMSGVGVPSGTVTLLVTDVEGSTRSWADRGEDMRDAMMLHDRLLREVIETHSGYVFTPAPVSFLVGGSRWRFLLHQAAGTVARTRATSMAVTNSTTAVRVLPSALSRRRRPEHHRGRQPRW
jgi:class 3 adenylate cyclase